VEDLKRPSIHQTQAGRCQKGFKAFYCYKCPVINYKEVEEFFKGIVIASQSGKMAVYSNFRGARIDMTPDDIKRILMISEGGTPIKSLKMPTDKEIASLYKPGVTPYVQSAQGYGIKKFRAEWLKEACRFFLFYLAPKQQKTYISKECMKVLWAFYKNEDTALLA
jgi:hypothetical protein